MAWNRLLGVLGDLVLVALADAVWGVGVPAGVKWSPVEKGQHWCVNPTPRAGRAKAKRERRIGDVAKFCANSLIVMFVIIYIPIYAVTRDIVQACLIGQATTILYISGCMASRL